MQKHLTFFWRVCQINAGQKRLKAPCRDKRDFGSWVRGSRDASIQSAAHHMKSPMEWDFLWLNRSEAGQTSFIKPSVWESMSFSSKRGTLKQFISCFGVPPSPQAHILGNDANDPTREDSYEVSNFPFRQFCDDTCELQRSSLVKGITVARPRQNSQPH